MITINKSMWRKEIVNNFNNFLLEDGLKDLELSEKPHRRVDKNAKTSDNPLLVLLHGYGSNECDLPGLAEEIINCGINIDWVSIQAPIDLTYQGIPNGYAWFAQPVPQNRKSLHEQAKQCANSILNWYKEQIKNSKISIDQKLIILGFSQGAAMTNYLLTMQELNGVIIGAVTLSGFLSFENELRTTKKIDVFHGYGVDDDVVPQFLSNEVSDWLKINSYPVIKKYENLQHSISLEELHDIVSFLETIIKRV